MSRNQFGLIIMMLIGLVFNGCDKKPSTKSDAGAGTDSASTRGDDTPTDNSRDTASSDGDSDADTDADSDADGDGDSDSDNDTGTGCALGYEGCACFANQTCMEGLVCNDDNICESVGSGADGDSDGDTDADGDTDGDSDGDTDGDTDADGDGDTDADTDGDTDADTDADVDGDTDSDTDADGDSDSATSTDTVTTSEPSTDSDSVPDTGSEAGDAGVCVEDGVEGCPCRAVDDENGPCNADLECNEEDICVSCPRDEIGCPCVDGACGDGLWCSEETCLTITPCDVRECEIDEYCFVPSANTDTICSPCLPGYVEVTVGQCEADTDATCDEEGENSILATCEYLGRECEADGEGAVCGDCLESNEVMDGIACRPQLTCDEVGCTSENRVCVETAGADPVCGDCVADAEEIAGICYLITDCGLCTAGQQRECVLEEGLAICGDCLEGYLENDEGECQPLTCEDLNCEAEHRTCSETPYAHCNDICESGWIWDNAENYGEGGCREPFTCADLTCDGDRECIEGDENTDAYCLGPNCPEGEGWDPVESVCRQCKDGFTPTCNAEGLSGNVLVSGDTDGADCFCEPADGYFIAASGGAERCDLDNDQWVNEEVLHLTVNNDPYESAKQRCDIHYIAQVVLINETSDWLTVSVSEVLPDENQVPLYESAINDGASSFGLTIDYGTSTLSTAVLNGFTKACAAGDFNDNNISDVREHPGGALDEDRFPSGTFLRDLYDFYQEFSYFIELHTSTHEIGTPGSYEIREKVRDASYVADAVPIQYPVDAYDYWAQCTRKKDSLYVGTSVASRAGGDFTNKSIEMFHHSQYKCIQVISQDAYDDDGRTKSNNPEIVFQGPYGEPDTVCAADEFCRLNASGQPERARWIVNDCENTSATGINIECTPRNMSSTIEQGTYFAAVGYENASRTTSQYLRGCINECEEIGDTACDNFPGTDFESPGHVCRTDFEDFFGDARCDCAHNYAGAYCEIGCPDGSYNQLFYNEDDADVWLCGQFTATATDSEFGPLLEGGGYSLNGYISVTPLSGELKSSDDMWKLISR